MADSKGSVGGGDTGKPKRNRLISRKKFREFLASHPDAVRDKDVFDRWGKAVERAVWTRFSQVKATFQSADQVGQRVVFNVGGNKYRIIAAIDYQRAKVYLKHVLTHAEYDRGKWRSGP